MYLPINTKNNYPHNVYTKRHKTLQVEIQEEATKEAVAALGLSQKHLKTLKLKFQEIDLDQSGSIDSEEFFEVLEEARSPFTDALFALIDLDGSGTIEFEVRKRKAWKEESKRTTIES